MTEARDWYEGRREGLGVEFLTALDEVFDRLRETPELYPPNTGPSAVPAWLTSRSSSPNVSSAIQSKSSPSNTPAR